MGENLLTQVTNRPEMTLDIGDELQHADPIVAGHPEHSAPSGERVSEMS